MEDFNDKNENIEKNKEDKVEQISYGWQNAEESKALSEIDPEKIEKANKKVNNNYRKRAKWIMIIIFIYVVYMLLFRRSISRTLINFGLTKMFYG